MLIPRNLSISPHYVPSTLNLASPELAFRLALSNSADVERLRTVGEGRSVTPSRPQAARKSTGPQTSSDPYDRLKPFPLRPSVIAKDCIMSWKTPYSFHSLRSLSSSFPPDLIWHWQQLLLGAGRVSSGTASTSLAGLQLWHATKTKISAGDWITSTETFDDVDVVAALEHHLVVNADVPNSALCFPMLPNPAVRMAALNGHRFRISGTTHLLFRGIDPMAGRYQRKGSRSLRRGINTTIGSKSSGGWRERTIALQKTTGRERCTASGSFRNVRDSHSHQNLALQIVLDQERKPPSKFLLTGFCAGCAQTKEINGIGQGTYYFKFSSDRNGVGGTGPTLCLHLLSYISLWWFRKWFHVMKLKGERKLWTGGIGRKGNGESPNATGVLHAA
ncbi:hypothetical protein FB451DRAFT_1183949 [Mycena latifolia]|nr:hypothetical protein FB451DRAFT_1183949 [Mycena latifolia]